MGAEFDYFAFGNTWITSARMAVVSRCVISRDVHPVAVARKRFIQSASAQGSMALVGSSRMRMFAWR